MYIRVVLWKSSKLKFISFTKVAKVFYYVLSPFRSCCPHHQWLNLSQTFKDLFGESPSPHNRIPQLGNSPILMPDDEASRDSGIFMSDDSDSASPVSYSKAPGARQLSFKSFLTSPNMTSEKTAFCNTKRSLYTVDEDATPVASELSFKSFFTSPGTTPEAVKSWNTRRSLFAMDDNGVKSPSDVDSPTTLTPAARQNKGAKRRLCVNEESDFSPVRQNKKVKIDSVQVQDSIKAAFNKENMCEDLIGDFSRCHCLPTVAGKHHDLKSISPDTVADIILREDELGNKFSNNWLQVSLRIRRWPHKRCHKPAHPGSDQQISQR